MNLFNDSDYEQPNARGLPDLQGSEKQIAWASKIRDKAFNEIDQILREWRLLIERYNEIGNTYLADTETQARIGALDALAVLEQERRAWVFIDGREWSARQWLSGQLPTRSTDF